MCSRTGGGSSATITLTLASRAALAWIAARQGRRDEAEEIYRQVLADRTRVLGSAHPDTEATRGDLTELTADRGTAHPGAEASYSAT